MKFKAFPKLKASSGVCQPFLAHGQSLKKYPMGRFAVPTSHGQLVETALHVDQ